MRFSPCATSIGLIVALVALGLLWPGSVKAEDEFPKRAPFTAVRWEGEVPRVEVEGVFEELLAVNEIPTSKILAFAKERYRGRWQKRFAEDFVQVMSEMGKPPGATVDLLLRDPKTGTSRSAKAVPLTDENRRAVMRSGGSTPRSARIERAHAPGVPPQWRGLVRRIEGGDESPISAVKAAEDLDQIEWALHNHYAYAERKGAPWREALDAVRAALGTGITRGAFGVQLMKVLALFGDGHTGLLNSPDGLLPRGYLPILVEQQVGGMVAYRVDRLSLLDPAHPFLVSMDGVAIEKWLEAAKSLTAAASPAFVRRNAPRMLRYVAWLRQELGLPALDELHMVLADKAGKRVELKLPLSDEKPIYGDWPRTRTRMLAGNVAYLRLAAMDDDETFVSGVLEALDGFMDAKGLVIDVRGNGGGSRVLLRRMLPRFLAPGSSRVANVAAYRLPPGEAPNQSEGYLENRFLWPTTASTWSAEARAAIEAFALAFEPEWKPGPGPFTAWHYMLVESPVGAPCYERPVVVLLDENCFSATDVFLAAFRGLPGVTLVGTPSGGGSGRARGVGLANSRLGLRMSSMASFRPDGRLYDGSSIEPDVVVEPTPGYLIGKEDPALEEALRRLR